MVAGEDASQRQIEAPPKSKVPSLVTRSSAVGAIERHTRFLRRCIGGWPEIWVAGRQFPGLDRRRVEGMTAEFEKGYVCASAFGPRELNALVAHRAYLGLVNRGQPELPYLWWNPNKPRLRVVRVAGEYAPAVRLEQERLNWEWVLARV